MKRILALNYSQSGQTTDIIESVFSADELKSRVQVDYCRIIPEAEYPLPWPSDRFFDVFPESVDFEACPIHLSEEIDSENYDLIVLGYPVWFLSPAIPFFSFLQSEEGKRILKGKPVITVLGVRNMWIMAQRRVKEAIKAAGGKLVGNMVFEDKAHNLVSVLTIIRWLLHGKKEAGKILPAAGVRDKDIERAKVFGPSILHALEQNSLEHLQNDIVKDKGVPFHFAVYNLEKNGFRIFKIWSRIIKKKGGQGDPKRIRRVRFFKNYLLFVIFIVSPLAELVFLLVKFLLYPVFLREKRKALGLD